MKTEFPNPNSLEKQESDTIPGVRHSSFDIRHLFRRNLWPYGIILTFVLFISATIGLVVMACAQKVDLVSENYYDQEIRFQSHLNRAARAQALGGSVSYSADKRQVRVELPGRVIQEKPVGQIDLYRPSAAALDRHLNLEPDARGIQRLDASTLAPGFWKVRVAWTCAGQDYFLEKSITVK